MDLCKKNQKTLGTTPAPGVLSFGQSEASISSHDYILVSDLEALLTPIYLSQK